MSVICSIHSPGGETQEAISLHSYAAAEEWANANLPRLAPGSVVIIWIEGFPMEAAITPESEFSKS